MTDTQNATQPAEAEVQARLKDLEEENELLLLQLHQVQEELERYFLKCRDLEKGGNGGWTGAAQGGWVDDELPSLQAEVFRLTSLVETQTRLREIESKNALNARLGDILIQSVAPSGSLVGLPGKLMGIWRASKAEQPSAALGGKNFDKVIEAFQAGGLEPVNQLLAKELAPEMRAKAYTALARHQMKNGLFTDAALSARRAYEEEPKPFRLKWLAFRLHDAGEIAEADACLSLLPQDTPFSDSEARQRDQVRYEAKSARLREAKQKTGVETRRHSYEEQERSLRNDRDKQAKIAADRLKENKVLHDAQSRLEQEKAMLKGQRDEAIKKVSDLQIEIVDLREKKFQIEQEKMTLSTLYDDNLKKMSELEEEIKAHQEVQYRLEQEKIVLSNHYEEKLNLLTELEIEFNIQRSVLSQLEQEKALLATQHAKADAMASERLSQMAEMKDKIKKMQNRESDLVSNLQLMREEVVRAEAQIELIKELWTRESIV